MAPPPAPERCQGAPAPAEGPPYTESTEVECPICYQEYNQFAKCPRMLECLHVFCTDCLQRMQLCPFDPPDPESPPAICCPLCRHPTPLGSGDALSLPCNSRILARLPPVTLRLPPVTLRLPPVTLRLPPLAASRLASLPQRVVLTLGACRDAQLIVLPSVSLRVERMHPGESHGGAPGLMDEAEVIRQHRRTLVCVQLMALAFWVLFLMTCVVGVVFGPGFFHN